MNKFIISGRLCSDFDVNYSGEGRVFARFDFAVNRKYKKDGEQEADFFKCVAFGKIAETLEKCNVAKGTKLLIDGEMRNNNYEKDGVKHYAMQVIVNGFEFCESKKNATQQEQSSPHGTADENGFTGITEEEREELPFY